MQLSNIDSSRSLNRYFNPQKQYSLQHRERTVEP